MASPQGPRLGHQYRQIQDSSSYGTDLQLESGYIHVSVVVPSIKQIHGSVPTACENRLVMVLMELL